MSGLPECFHAQEHAADCRWFLGVLHSARVLSGRESLRESGSAPTIPANPANHLRMIIAKIGVKKEKRRNGTPSVSIVSKQRTLLRADNDLQILAEGFLTDG